jgi:hypothetical protein
MHVLSYRELERKVLRAGLRAPRRGAMCQLVLDGSGCCWGRERVELCLFLGLMMTRLELHNVE